MENQGVVDLEIHRNLISSEGISGFVKYLDSIRDNRPFNLTTIAVTLGLPQEQIEEYFTIIRHTFRLFHHIQKDKIIQADDIFTHTQQLSRDVVLTSEEMEKYATFAYLANKKPFSSLSPMIRVLYEQNELLFQVTTEQDKRVYEASYVGNHFAAEYRKLKVLNMPVSKIEFKNLSLLLTK